MDADLCLGDNLILFRCYESKKKRIEKVQRRAARFVSNNFRRKPLFRAGTTYSSSNFQSKFATTNSNFEKKYYLDMHYCIT